MGTFLPENYCKEFHEILILYSIVICRRPKDFNGNFIEFANHHFQWQLVLRIGIWDFPAPKLNDRPRFQWSPLSILYNSVELWSHFICGLQYISNTDLNLLTKLNLLECIWMSRRCLSFLPNDILIIWWRHFLGNSLKRVLWNVIVVAYIDKFPKQAWNAMELAVWYFKLQWVQWSSTELSSRQCKWHQSSVI